MSVELSSTYLGLRLANPLVVASGPLSEKVDTLRQLEQAGAAAVVLPSLFEEQIRHQEEQAAEIEHYGTERFAEALTYLPILHRAEATTDTYLKHVEAAKKAVSIPVIASLNGATKGGWIQYAKRMEEAGADAIELNIYIFNVDPNVSGQAVEDQYVELLQAVRESVSVPVAVKIGPFFSSLPHFAQRLADVGADGLVLFNRYPHPKLNLDELKVSPQVDLSVPSESRLVVRWIAVLRDQLTLSLAATGGFHTSEDIIRALMAGADAVQVLSVLLHQGPAYLSELLGQMRTWLEEHEYESVEQLKGSMSRLKSPDPSAYERANYLLALTKYTCPLP